MYKRVFVIMLGLMLTATVVTGCQKTAEKPMNPQQNTTSKTGNMDISASERRVMASRLSQIAQNVSGVKTASVVLTTGQTVFDSAGNPGINPAGTLIVLVGLTLNPSVSKDENQTSRVKKTVIDRIKANDRRIAQVLVTTDAVMIKRLNDIAAGIIEGKPIQSYEKNVDNLARDLKKSK